MKKIIIIILIAVSLIGVLKSNILNDKCIVYKGRAIIYIDGNLIYYNGVNDTEGTILNKF